VLLQNGRWPAIVDKEHLKKEVAAIVGSGPEFDAKFYQTDLSAGGFACQGDIIRFKSAAPFIDSDGSAVTTDAVFDFWMILGNTCDMHRVDEQRSLIAPLVALPDELPEARLRALRKYEYSRQFYVPSWPDTDAPRHHLVDFMQNATIHKDALRNGSTQVVARLQFPSWALLHLCLVRYLARDDGRFD